MCSFFSLLAGAEFFIDKLILMFYVLISRAVRNIQLTLVRHYWDTPPTHSETKSLFLAKITISVQLWFPILLCLVEMFSYLQHKQSICVMFWELSKMSNSCDKQWNENHCSYLTHVRTVVRRVDWISCRVQSCVCQFLDVTRAESKDAGGLYTKQTEA